MVLAVVQSAAHSLTANHTAVVFTWGAAPTHGNLLITIGACWDDNLFSPQNGWANAVAPTTAGAWRFFCAYKYAGVSEPTAAAIDANTHLAWSVHAWEISGVQGVLAGDLIAASIGILSQSGPTSAAISPSSVNSQAGATLALYALNSYSQVASTTYSWAAGWTADSQFCSTVADGSNSLFDYATGAHKALSGITALAPTITPSQSTFWGNSIVQLGETALNAGAGNLSLLGVG